MGLLLKVILFGLVFYYIFKTVGGFVFRILGVQSPQQQQRTRQAQQKKREGEINIEYMPKDQQKQGAKGSSKEGDYIDYEEVK